MSDDQRYTPTPEVQAELDHYYDGWSRTERNRKAEAEQAASASEPDTHLEDIERFEIALARLGASTERLREALERFGEPVCKCPRGCCEHSPTQTVNVDARGPSKVPDDYYRRKAGPVNQHTLPSDPFKGTLDHLKSSETYISLTPSGSLKHVPLSDRTWEAIEFLRACIHGESK